MPDPAPGSVPLPKHWPAHVRSAIVAAVGLAHTTITLARSWAINSPIARARLAGENDRSRTEVALLRRELDLLHARFQRMPPSKRPHFSPTQRLEVLELKAARGWNASQAAARLLLAPSTVADWLRRLEDDGREALVQVSVPINRFPDLICRLTQDLARLLPTMGRRRIAQLLARAGLHLSASTVRRMLHRPWLREPDPPPPKHSAGSIEADSRPVIARRAHHVWHCDTTVVPISSGLWTPWYPFTLPTFWPFSWHVAVVLDQFSRKLLGFQVFFKEPSARDITHLLDTTIACVGATPKYIVTDRGTQFRAHYVQWCSSLSITPRFGAIGKKGSIAVIERFLLSLKNEALRRILVPMSIEQMRREIALYGSWYNQHRPHQSLGGRTPDEVHFALKSARDGPRFEPRPLKQSAAPLRAPAGSSLEVVVDSEQGRPHLPLIQIRKAA